MKHAQRDALFIMSDLIETFLSNANLMPYRETSMAGKTFLVVRGVPIIEGVLNSVYVPVTEFGAFTADWNGVPVVLNHPSDNDGSARVPFPDVPVVGRFYDAKIKGDKLTGEFWLDVNELEKSDEGKALITKIKANKMIEVSTGYFAKFDKLTGKFGDQEYIGVARNIHPDHIAILPNNEGACSLKDGCGLNRNVACANCACTATNKENPMADEPVEPVAPVAPVVPAVTTPIVTPAVAEPNFLAQFLAALFPNLTPVQNVTAPAAPAAPAASPASTPASASTPAAGPSLHDIPANLQALSGLVDSLGGIDKLKKLLLLVEKEAAVDATEPPAATAAAPVKNAAQIAADAEVVKRTGIITKLVANKAIGLTAIDLALLPTSSLEALQEKHKVKPVTFAGRGVSVVVNASDADPNAPKIAERKPVLLRKRTEA